MPNRLADEISPYLLQHAENPVDWHPWNEDALARARREEKPIFLSIGYSACHWCHVMAHESFENHEIADLLKEGFVSIKVDREERPDLDQIYMEAVQAMTGHGGWPLSVFLTPDMKPFYGGTYWPVHSRQGMPGFDQVLSAVHAAWKTRRKDIYSQAEQVAQFLRENQIGGHGQEATELDDRPLYSAEASFRQTFDARFGGFGGAPKFPPAMALSLLIRRWRREPHDDLRTIVTTTLDRMAAGGIYDHLGGGFHRYSVDARWLVPHFEKMLYDNALLSTCYLDAWLAFGEPAYAEVVRQTLDYVLRDMTDPRGGFYASEDADSEGEEGRFYIWTPNEIREVLGDDAGAKFCRIYDVTEAGNFEGRNILNLSRPLATIAQMLDLDVERLRAELPQWREALLARRSARIRPARDEKVLVSWNGLMIDAMARAGHELGEPRFSRAATEAAEFVDTALRDERGRLRHCWREGRTRGGALLDDYGSLAGAMVTLYETLGDRRWLDCAVGMAEEIQARFSAPEGAFYYTPEDHEPLISRKIDMIDSSVPSGNGLAAMLFVRLARLPDGERFAEPARRTLALLADVMRQVPTGTGQLLLALDGYLEPVGDCSPG
ncbi:MAG: thioredoxin domain-containing protein [Planctomycetota bacterium]